MGQNTKIEWCHHTLNPWRGCTKISAGCANCYAEKLSHRNPKSLGVWGDDGTRVVASEGMWREPLKWDRLAKDAGERHRVFCASLADVFEDRDELIAPRARLFALIDATPNLDWMLLTKRPENIRRFWVGGHRVNIWRGTSVEDQKNADVRIIELVRTNDLSPIAFLSMEPLLGAVDLRGKLVEWHRDGSTFFSPVPHSTPKHLIHHVIVGGESGPRARACNLEWFRPIIAQCRAAKVPCFVKQLGSLAWDGPGFKPGTINAISMRLRDNKGGDPSEWPKDLRVREILVLS